MVVVSLDTVRSDRLPAYGYEAGETPVLDDLAGESLLFERAYSPVPLTGPAHASLFTGLLPPDHGIRDNAGYRLGELPTVAGLFRDAGFRTAGFVSSFVLRSETGLDRGFELWDDDLDVGPQATIAEIQRPGPVTTERAIRWLREREPDEKLFLFLHLYDPHAPYSPPEPFRSRLPDPYDGEIAFVDAAIGQLRQALRETGRWGDATFVVLSDHGEGLGDHGEDEHGILLYREAIQVPLILKLPGNDRAGERVPRPVLLTDVAPTLLEIAGLARPEGLDGASLLDGVPGAARALYGESFHPRLRFGWSELTSLIDGRWHYIHGPAPELYDLVEDPGETRNVLAENRRVYADLRDALEAVDTNLEEPFETDDETRQALASLGYLGGGATSGDAEDRPDPKSRLDTLVPLRQGVRALQEGDAARAEALLLRALAQNDQLLDGWQFLGVARDRLGKKAAAFEAYERAFRMSNGSPALAEPLARLALELGRTQDALAFLGLAAEADPGNTEIRLLQVRTLLLTGRPSEAVARADELVADAPSAEALHYRGAARMATGELAAAEADLRRALERDPGYLPALSDLAILLASQERFEEAREAARRILDLEPGHPGAQALLARLERAA